ncbi:MAG: glycosyltransferase, partial [Chloroflexi bacterium]|nr:glycosyltransferase [Chloroflexota bacterium]
VVPACNESGRVGATVTALQSIKGVAAVVVVDDGSADATAEEATRAGALVVRLGRRLGKGGALNQGVDAAGSPDAFLLVDADLGASASALGALLEPLVDGRADVTIAAPPRDEGPSGFGLVEKLGRWGIRRLAGNVMDRPLSGQRAIRREVVEAVGRFAPGFGVDAAFTIDALRAGYRVFEVPVVFTHARTGRDTAGFVHRARQGVDVARALAGRRRRR